jgi:hypothetical protein
MCFSYLSCAKLQNLALNTFILVVYKRNLGAMTTGAINGFYLIVGVLSRPIIFYIPPVNGDKKSIH